MKPFVKSSITCANSFRSGVVRANQLTTNPCHGNGVYGLSKTISCHDCVHSVQSKDLSCDYRDHKPFPGRIDRCYDPAMTDSLYSWPFQTDVNKLTKVSQHHPLRATSSPWLNRYFLYFIYSLRLSLIFFTKGWEGIPKARYFSECEISWSVELLGPYLLIWLAY